MNDFKKNNSRGGGRRFGGFDNKRSDREMHDATCASCGNRCKVPFRPSGDKPVYCSDCFEKQNGGSKKPFSFNSYDKRKTSMRGGGERWDQRPRQSSDNNTAKELAAINNKLDLILDILKTDS